MHQCNEHGIAWRELQLQLRKFQGRKEGRNKREVYFVEHLHEKWKAISNNGTLAVRLGRLSQKLEGLQILVVQPVQDHWIEMKSVIGIRMSLQ